MTNPEEPDDDTEIWRYLELYQLLSILNRESLYFARTDNMDDPYEGSLPSKNKDILEENLLNSEAIDGDEGLKRISDALKRNRLSTFLNCWHINQHGESAAMWNHYSGEGVAIKTTYKNLKRFLDFSGLGLDRDRTDDDVIFGEVKYLDYREDGNLVNPYKLDHWSKTIFHKRKSFESEREVRVAIFEPVKYIDQGEKWPKNSKLGEFPEEKLENQKYVDVDIEGLVDEVRVSPSKGEFFQEIVEDVVAEYGYENIPVKQSDLSTDPIY